MSEINQEMVKEITKTIDKMRQNIVVMAFDNLCYNKNGIITLSEADNENSNTKQK